MRESHAFRTRRFWFWGQLGSGFYTKQKRVRTLLKYQTSKYGTPITRGKRTLINGGNSPIFYLFSYEIWRTKNSTLLLPNRRYLFSTTISCAQRSSYNYGDPATSSSMAREIPQARPSLNLTWTNSLTLWKTEKESVGSSLHLFFLWFWEMVEVKFQTVLVFCRNTPTTSKLKLNWKS